MEFSEWLPGGTLVRTDRQGRAARPDSAPAEQWLPQSLTRPAPDPAADDPPLAAFAARARRIEAQLQVVERRLDTAVGTQPPRS